MVTPLAADIVLIFNFLAIIPLSGLVHLACEDLSATSNPTLGKLLIAFSDNLVELVVSDTPTTLRRLCFIDSAKVGIVALCKGEIYLVQVSIIGSVLCYSLLVSALVMTPCRYDCCLQGQIMGSCFLVHGIRYSQGRFNDLPMNSITLLNVFAMCCLLIPSTLHMVLEAHDTTEFDDLMVILSHGIAIILLNLYILYIVFSLRTHSDFFVPEEDERNTSAAVADLSLGPVAASIWLIVSLTCVTLCTVALVSSIQGSTWKAKKSFLGFVLFPFLGNLTDYLSASMVALKDELDITILVTIRSSMQLLLFTLPVLVILGWMINEPITFNLDLFETVTVFLGVFVVRYVVADGKSNYLCGAMCIAL